jgi:D-glycero-alpha-D-manno-heptose-7-phosphate kinase
MVDEALKILTENRDIKDFGRLLHESWKLKRGLTDKISTPEIDDIYKTAYKNGAIGGKLLGAGGGGFMILFVEPDKQSKVKKSLKNILHVPFRFENSGSEIIFYRDSYIPFSDNKKLDKPAKLKIKITETKSGSNKTVRSLVTK